MPTRNLIISNLWKLVTADANNLPLKVQNTYIPPPTIDGLMLGGVKQGANITISIDGTISSSAGGGGTLQSLTDVSIVEPTFVNTGNLITNITPGTLTVSVNPPALLSVGDWIRGDAIANGPVVQITAINVSTISVAVTVGFGFVALSGIFKVSSITLAGQVLTWDVATNKWIAKTPSYGTIQNPAAVAVLQRPTVQFVGSGVSSVVDDSVNNRTVVTITGGGGGGTFTVVPVWTGGTATKLAFTAPGTVNNVGISMRVIASSGSGGITAATVILNTVALPNLYNSTGTWPNLSITIPVADLINNPAEIAPSVAISITGTFAGGGINIADAGTLTNTQPIPFTTTLSGRYALTTRPYYATTGTLAYSYSNSAAITAFQGIFTPGGAASATSGTFANIAFTGSTISGTATGNGLNGAGISTVTLSGSVSPPSIYTPAFYTQSSNSTVPTFTTATTQTPGSQIGATITFPVAILTTQYDWVATTQPIGNVFIVTPFGNSPLIPDVTSTATIAAVSFNVFGFTSLGVGVAAQIVITA